MTALERAWYRDNSWALLLAPLTLLFRALAYARRRILQARHQGQRFAAPVIVVGNIAVGGAGKTPLIIALARRLQAAGLRPGIVSRGYGGAEADEPLQLNSGHSPGQVGDEPRLIADSTACPVVVCPDRVRAVAHLLQHNDCNVVLSDDGLQHYRLHRDIEIAVVDGERGVGNGWCLPAGPLRESPARLREVDMVVVNGAGYQPRSDFFTMDLVATGLRHLATGNTILPHALEESWQQAKQIHAVAGIANPQRFQRSLEDLGFIVTLHSFPDHHIFSAADFSFADDAPVIITAKDAVKCHDLNSGDFNNNVNDNFNHDNIWVLDVEAQLPDLAWQQLIAALSGLSVNQTDTHATASMPPSKPHGD